MEENQMDQTESEKIQIQTDGKNKNGKGIMFLWGMLSGVLICVIFFGTVLFGIKMVKRIVSTVGNASGSSEAIVNSETVKKIEQLEELVENQYYLADVSEEELRNGMYEGMIAALNDPYSEYYTVEELQEALASNQGISYGIGAYISLDQDMDRAVIAGVMDGAPAEEAGLREGDIIYKVDGTDTTGMSVSQVVSMVKGQENTSVHLTIYRKDEPDYIEVDIVRSKLIETSTVQYGMIEDEQEIGYLRITEFDKVTPDQFNEAMAELKAKEMKGLILDLRSNPGGDLAAVTEVARRLLPKGIIVYTEDKAGERIDYTCDGKNELQIPMVVLVNEYSASASEILSGAIQDYNKGTLIGTTTYGKGIVQKIIPFDDGTALKLTISAYYTPNGRNIHGIGIEPDIELEYDYEAAQKDGSDNQVQKAIEVLKEKIQ